MTVDGSATLIFDLAQYARVALPRTILIENVPELMGQCPDLLRNALDVLRFGEGRKRRLYYASTKILSAADFGAPTIRRRLVVLAVRTDAAHNAGIRSDADVATLYPEPTHFCDCADPARRHIDLRSAFSGLKQTEADKAPFRRSMLNTSLGRYARLMPVDPEKFAYTHHAGFSKLSRFTLIRSSFNRPAPTITATGQAPDWRSGVLHPTEPRKLTLPELRRVTGLPDDFRLTGSVGRAAATVGMMVPPALIQAVAKSLLDRVLRQHRDA